MIRTELLKLLRPRLYEFNLAEYHDSKGRRNYHAGPPIVDYLISRVDQTCKESWLDCSKKNVIENFAWELNTDARRLDRIVESLLDLVRDDPY